MGNIGSIVIDFINRSLNTRVVFAMSLLLSLTTWWTKGGILNFSQKGGNINTEGTIEFGGSTSQPQTNAELYEMCEDVIDVAKKYSAQLIYTVGAFHTSRYLSKQPKTFVTTSSPELMEQAKRLGVETTLQSFFITGFNGLILGFSKSNNIRGIGVMGRLMIRKYLNIERPKIFCSYWTNWPS